jgi:hypothetical protein
MRLLAALIATVAAVGAGYAVAVVAPWNPADVFTGSGGQPASAGLEDEANSREELPSVDDDVERYRNCPIFLSILP